MALSKDETKQIFAWFDQHRQCTLEDFQLQFGVNSYTNRVLVFMHIDFYPASWSSTELMTHEQLKLLQEYKEDLYLGEINGPRSEIMRTFEELVQHVERDPEEIASWLKTHAVSYTHLTLPTILLV